MYTDSLYLVWLRFECFAPTLLWESSATTLQSILLSDLVVPEARVENTLHFINHKTMTEGQTGRKRIILALVIAQNLKFRVDRKEAQSNHSGESSIVKYTLFSTLGHRWTVVEQLFDLV